MKLQNIFFLFGLLLVLGACTIDDQVDPDGPSINSVAENASIAELNLLVTGIEGRMRNGFATYADASGSIARELYKFDADPRNTAELLGKEGAPLDNNTFYLTSPYSTRYRVVKNCNILLDALDNTNTISGAQKDGYRGYANTIKAYMLFQVLNMLDDCGIRIDVGNPENLGPFVDKGQAFTQLLALLDQANGQLSGAEFRFTLSDGFAGFDTPSTFAQFNRALAAKVATYGRLYEVVDGILANSFYDLNGALDVGPKHVFSTAAGDVLNPLFKTPGQSGDQYVVHDRIIQNATAGDARLSKFRERTSATAQDDLNGTHETALFSSALDPIDIIRNEELILIAAEAAINTNRFADAVDHINVIRNAHGIGDYTGASDEDSLIDEMLYQRCYSFWGEGHRMWDLRRYDRLNSDFLPLDRAGDVIHTKYPVPLSEGVICN